MSSGLPGYLFPLFRCEFIGPRLAAFLSTKAAKCYGMRILMLQSLVSNLHTKRQGYICWFVLEFLSLFLCVNETRSTFKFGFAS